MKLLVEITPDFHGSISITDYTLEFNEYIPEEITELLPRYYHFKYSQTCTIDIIEYVSIKEDKLLDTIYSKHGYDPDSIRYPLKRDGYYHVHHIVLPTIEWYNQVHNLDLNEYNFIYLTDGYGIYKIVNNEIIQVDPKEIIEVNPFKTTISISSNKVFCIDRLKQCYINASINILDNYVGKCSIINPEYKFNRDFLWMTLNVIKYLLEFGDYELALVILEDLTCHNFCDTNLPFKQEKSCGCKKKSN